MKKTILYTPRLLLRPWEVSDTEDLYRYASDPEVGPIAGWAPHKNLQESARILISILQRPETFALCLKTDGKAIGSIALHLKGDTDMTNRRDECEMGYWLGKPFWGQGIMPEAVKEMLRHAFVDCHMRRVWIGYYEGNDKSRRVQEKCGFIFHHKSENLEVKQLKEIRTGYVNYMTREDWEKLCGFDN